MFDLYLKLNCCVNLSWINLKFISFLTANNTSNITSLQTRDNGQFFTPEPICDMMARMLHPAGFGERVADCCCGSGRMLMAAAKISRNSLFFGADIDRTCAMMCVINLCLNGLLGRSLLNEHPAEPLLRRMENWTSPAVWSSVHQGDCRGRKLHGFKVAGKETRACCPTSTGR